MTADRIGEYSVPVDPMDDLQCESCQKTPGKPVIRVGWDYN